MTTLLIVFFSSLFSLAQCSADAGLDITKCSEQGTSIGGLTAGTGNGTITYTWSPSVGLSCNDCPNPICSATVNTTYTLTITDGDGCIAIDEIAVFITANPDASFSFSTLNSCSNFPVQFSPGSTAGIQSYQWNFGDPTSGDGMLRTQAGYLSYSYRPVETKKFILQFGASGGLVNKSIDWSRLVFSDQLDDVYGKVNATQFISPNFKNSLYPDFNAGIAIRFNHRNKINKGFKRAAHTTGFAIHHLNKPKDAFLLEKDYLPMKLVFHYNSNILVNNLIISPGFIYELQNEFKTVTLGMYFSKKPISLGVWFRNRSFTFSTKSYDAFIVSIGLNLPLKNERYLKLTYSIDFTISKLRTSSFGTNELSLIYNLDNRYLLKKSQAKQAKKAMY